MLPFLESWAACCLVVQSCPTLCDPTDSSAPGSSVHGDSPGKNTGVGCHFLLQGIFLTPGTSPQAVKPPRHRAGKKVVGGLAVPLAATGAPGFPPAHGQGCVWSCGSDTIWERARRPPQAAEGTGSYSRLGCYAIPNKNKKKSPSHPPPVFLSAGSSSRAFLPVVLPCSHQLMLHEPAPTMCDAHPSGWFPS